MLLETHRIYTVVHTKEKHYHSPVSRRWGNITVSHPTACRRRTECMYDNWNLIWQVFTCADFDMTGYIITTIVKAHRPMLFFVSPSIASSKNTPPQRRWEFLSQANLLLIAIHVHLKLTIKLEKDLLLFLHPNFLIDHINHHQMV